MFWKEVYCRLNCFLYEESIELERNKRKKEPKDLRTNYPKIWNICMLKNTQKTQKAYFCLHYPSPLDQNNEEGFSNLLLKHHARGSLPVPGSNGIPCFWRPKMAGKNKSRQYLLWPQFLLSSNHPCPTIQHQSWSCFIKTNMSIILTTALGLYFLQKFPASRKIYWVNLHAIVLLLCALL